MKTDSKTFMVQYLETWLPPRCEKLRYRVVEDTMTFAVSSYSAEEVPVAFRVSGKNIAEGDVRFDGSRHYRRLLNEDDYEDWGAWLLAVSDLNLKYPSHEKGDIIAEEACNDREKLICQVEAILSNVCLVDSELWEACEEPGWWADTWWKNHRRHVTARVGGRCAVVKWNALQRDEAEAAAIASSTAPIELVRDQGEYIEVLIPEAVKSDPCGKALTEARVKCEELLAKAREECDRAIKTLDEAVVKEMAYREANEGAPWLHPST